MINLIIKNSDKLIINLDLLKSHLRIANNYEDDYLKTIINTATCTLENILELSILYKTYKYIVNNHNVHYSIVLPIKNVNIIQSITDSDNNNVQFETNNKYEINLRNINNKFPINIQYIAGFTDNTEEIPNDIKLSILQISKNIYDNSEENILDSKYIQSVINKYKQINL